MQLKATTTLATPTLFQMTIAEYLATGGYDHHLRKVRKVYAEQVLHMTQSVQRHFPEGTRTTRPQGGSVLWVQLPGEVDTAPPPRPRLRRGHQHRAGTDLFPQGQVPRLPPPQLRVGVRRADGEGAGAVGGDGAGRDACVNSRRAGTRSNVCPTPVFERCSAKARISPTNGSRSSRRTAQTRTSGGFIRPD